MKILHAIGAIIGITIIVYLTWIALTIGSLWLRIWINDCHRKIDARGQVFWECEE